MKYLVIIFSIITACSASAQTLADYLQLAAENNPGIRARQTEFQAALQKLPQARALPDPEISAGYFIGHMILPEGNQIGSVSAMQMFPWFGTLDAMENEAARMADVKRQQVAVVVNELIFKVKSAWFPLLEVEEKLRILRQMLSILETDKELATFKFQHGQAPMVDAIRADIMIDELKTEIALLELERKPLQVAFNKLLDRDAGAPLVISDTLPEVVPGYIFRQDSLLLNNPALAVFDRQIQAAVAEQKVAENMRKPMVGAGIQYMPLRKRKGGDIHEVPPNTGVDMFMAMATVTVPIWRKKYNAAIEERRLMQTMYADMKSDMQNELATEYEMTWYELDKMSKMLELLDVQILKTRQAIDLLLAAYQNNGEDFEEILMLQRQVYEYQLEKVSAKTGYQLMLVKLDYLIGK